MAELVKPAFLCCTPTQYKQGKVHEISEIVSPEEECSFSYSCAYTSKEQNAAQIFSGEKTLYAYPLDLEKLVLGHTVLDILPCYDADFTCDVQGGGSFFQVKLQAQPSIVPARTLEKMSYANVLHTMDTVLNAPGLWDGTGCFHRAGLYHPCSQELILAEDIGRHNCIDRLKGHSLLHNLPIEEYVLFITARITASLYAKIYRAGIRAMVSRSAITTTSYTRAQKDGCTLAAFCRPEDARLTHFAGQGFY